MRITSTQEIHFSWLFDAGDALAAGVGSAGSGAGTDERNQIVLQGTWAATKAAQGWRGSWSARVTSDRPPGETLTGTWQAEGALAGQTFADLLQGTLVKEVTGSWQSRGRAGKWKLTGSRP